MGKTVEISVIMAAYNEKEEYIREAIESILGQSYKNFELIIVLDNPKNKKLKRIIEEYEKQDNRIRFFVNEENLGAHSTRNKAIDCSYGKYIAIMDADDISEKKRLEWQINVMKKKTVDIISGYVSVIDENGNLIYLMDNLPENHEDIKKKIRINNCMPHSALMARREVYKVLKGYYEMPNGEDYDFLARAVLKGYRLYNIPKVIVKYRMTKGSLSRKNLFQQYLIMQYCQQKYFKGKEIGSCEEYLAKCYTKQKAQKYAKASEFFTRGCQALTQKEYSKMVKDVFRAFIISSDYRKKMFRYVLQLDWKKVL